MVDNAETIFYTVTFLLPGFIIFYVKSRMIPQRSMSGYNSIFRHLFYSSINMLIAMPLLHHMESSNYSIEKPEHIIVLWIMIVIILPILLGIVSAIISSKRIYKRILSKVCPTMLDEMPSSWDYKFNDLYEPRYAIVKLKDGSTVRGVYASGSYASPELAERDIYLEELLDVNKDGNWVKIPNSDGVLIKASQIVSIEFRKIPRVGENNEGTIIELLRSIEDEVKESNKSTMLKGGEKR